MMNIEPAFAKATAGRRPTPNAEPAVAKAMAGKASNDALAEEDTKLERISEEQFAWIREQRKMIRSHRGIKFAV